MKLKIGDNYYDVVIERKRGNKNTYLRVKPDLTILVTTNSFTSERKIGSILEEHSPSIARMLSRQRRKNQEEDAFYYLGKKNEIVYTESMDVKLGETKVFLSHETKLDVWYRRQAEVLFSQHLLSQYQQFTEKIPFPVLKIRKMKSRWGVCNTRDKVVTLNLELIKREIKYLDYVIVHELAHLVYPNHSKDFWRIVEKNLPNYKILRKEMKEY